MSHNRIAIVADHAGVKLKGVVRRFLDEERRHEILDLGTHDAGAVDYPDQARAIVAALRGGQAEHDLPICGTGNGMSIAANRHRGIRAALCYDAAAARLAPAHNDANVLELGARMSGAETAKECVDAFLNTPFDGGRHARRIEKIG